MTPHLTFELFRYFLLILDRLFPKTENLLLFPVQDRQEFRDNIRFFHDSASRHPEFECVILCYQKGGWNGDGAIFFHSLEGLLAWLRARIIIIHHGRGDIPYSDSMDFRRRKLINLWHGIPVKGIGYTARNEDEQTLRQQFKVPRATICSSELDQLAMQASFRLPRQRVWTTGLPRNDMLLQAENDLAPDLREESAWLEAKLQGRKMVLYLPTWREELEDSTEFTREQCRKLSEMLERHDAVFCVKKHPNTPALTFDGMEVLDVSESLCREVGTLLRHAHVLVTDYSSAWIDYLLLDRPVVSYCYDLESYMQNRGLLYDYESIFPGKLNHTFESFLAELQKALNNGIPGRQQVRVKRLFHKYSDGNNSRRVCDYLASELRVA